MSSDIKCDVAVTPLSGLVGFDIKVKRVLRHLMPSGICATSPSHLSLGSLATASRLVALLCRLCMRVLDPDVHKTLLHGIHVVRIDIHSEIFPVSAVGRCAALGEARDARERSRNAQVLPTDSPK
eukprot:1573346-Pyramimonas_sp.AAC.2